MGANIVNTSFATRIVRRGQSLGLTGRSSTMTEDQCREMCKRILLLRKAGFDVLHHGDCIGADAVAHRYAIRLGYRVVIHPPDNDRKRAFCATFLGRFGIHGRSGLVATCDAAPYLVRNQHIVNESDVLIAVTEGPEDRYPRSGTWATVRRARKAGLTIHCINP